MATKVRRRAFGYVRLSKDTPDTTSPARQREAIERLCADRRWELVHTFEDIDVSAYNGRHRPHFDNMMRRLHEIDAIVFWRLDRLSRNVREGGEIAERCKAAEVDLVAVADGQDRIDTTSADGEFQFTLLMGLGQREVRLLSERTKAGVDKAREQGAYLGGRRYGWRWSDKRLVPDRRQQAVLRKAAKRYIAGDSFNAIARELSDEYVASLPKTRMDGSPSTHKHPEQPRRLYTHALSRMLQDARVHDALGDLGDELARAVAARRGPDRARPTVSLLGGIATCQMCGGSLRLSSTGAGRGGRWTQYRCAKTGHAGIAAPFLEQHVTAAVMDAIDIPELTRRMRARLRRPPKAVEVIAIEARLQNLEDSFGDGTLSKAAFIRQRDRQLTKLEAARQATVEEQVPELPLELARHLPERWPTMTTIGKREVIQALVREVRVSKATDAHGTGKIDPSRVTISWRA